MRDLRDKARQRWRDYGPVWFVTAVVVNLLVSVWAGFTTGMALVGVAIGAFALSTSIIDNIEDPLTAPLLIRLLPLMIVLWVFPTWVAIGVLFTRLIKRFDAWAVVDGWRKRSRSNPAVKRPVR